MSKQDVTIANSIANISLPMWIFDQKTLVFLEVNKAASRIYGYSRSEFLSLTVLDIRPAEDIPSFLQIAVCAPKAKIRATEMRHRSKRGDIILVDITSREIQFRNQKAELVCVRRKEIDSLITFDEVWESLQTTPGTICLPAPSLSSSTGQQGCYPSVQSINVLRNRCMEEQRVLSKQHGISWIFELPLQLMIVPQEEQTPCDAML